MRPRFLVLTILLLVASVQPAFAWEILAAPAGEQAGSEYGGSVCAVGDVDGNGLEDFVVGAPSYDDDRTNSGRAYLYLPRSDGTIPPPVVLNCGTSVYLFGKNLSAAGDVNGDGFADFLISSESMGAVHLFLGASDPAAIARVVIPQPEDRRTTDAAGAGDVDGDGFDDVMVAAFWDNRVWIYRGGPAFDTTPDYLLQGTGNFGLAMAPLGDFNDDGFDDFAIGSPNESIAGFARGAVRFYLGGQPLDTTADFQFLGRAYSDAFGRHLRQAADMNGDGRTDLLVGTDSQGGRLEVLCLDPIVGAFDGPEIRTDIGLGMWNFDGNADIDLDGLPDVVVAPDLYLGSHLILFAGTSLSGMDVVDTSAADFIESLPVSAVTSIGDLNGDGLRELLVGCDRDNTGGLGGRVLVMAGGHRRVLQLRAQRVTAGPDTVATVLITARVDATDPGATLELAALDLELQFDQGTLWFESIEPTDPDAGWLFAGSGSSTRARVSMATLTPVTFDTTEQPLLTLRVRTGTIAGGSPVSLFAMEAHASASLPLLAEFEPGRVTISRASAAGVPSVTASLSAHPNPFNPRTRLQWVSATDGPVRLTVFDARGRRVWSHETVGSGAVDWNGVDDAGRPVPSGAYFVEARGPQWHARTRITLVR